MRHRAGIGLEGRIDGVGILIEAGEAGARRGCERPSSIGPRLEQLLDLGLADVDERREVLVVAREVGLEQLAVRGGTSGRRATGRRARATASPTPSRAQISSVSRCMQIALEPMRSRPGSARSRATVDAVLGEASGQRQADRTGTDDRDVRSSARVSRRARPRPRGRAPRSRSAGVDAVQLVPRSLDVERHGVVEDRDAGVARRKLGMDALEGLLQRPAAPP